MVLISKKWRVIYVGYGGASVGPSFATEREASKFLYDTRGGGTDGDPDRSYCMFGTESEAAHEAVKTLTYS